MRSTQRRVRALVVSFALLLPVCEAQPPGAGGVGADGAGESELAPDFTLPSLTGNPVRLADFRGRTVIVDFWATWCAPCVFQIPILNALWEDHRDRGDLVVLGIAIDIEGADVVGPWIAERRVTYPILLGDEALAREYGVPGFPTLFVIRPDGTVHSMHIGLIDREELERLVEEARMPAASAATAAQASAKGCRSLSGILSAGIPERGRLGWNRVRARSCG